MKVPVENWVITKLVLDEKQGLAIGQPRIEIDISLESIKRQAADERCFLGLAVLLSVKFRNNREDIELSAASVTNILLWFW